MLDETDEVMKSTKYHGRGLFYHDALSQLCSKETRLWMEQNDCAHRWIVPVLDCNKVCGSNNKRYDRRPVGNSPETQPLDNSLFQDCHVCVKTQVAVTWHLPKDHPHKFSLSTPSRAYHAYSNARCLDKETGGAPSSKRIIEDVDKMLHSLQVIADNKGNVVDGLSSRAGHRRYVESVKDSTEIDDEEDLIINDGRYEEEEVEETTLEDRWLHPDGKAHLSERKVDPCSLQKRYLR